MNKKSILAIWILGIFLLVNLSLVSALCRDSNGYYGDCGFNYNSYYSYKPSYVLDAYPQYNRPVYNNNLIPSSRDNNYNSNYNSYNYNRPQIFAGPYDRYIVAKIDYMNTYHGNYYDSGYSSGPFYSGASPYSGYYGYGGYGGGYGYYGGYGNYYGGYGYY